VNLITHQNLLLLVYRVGNLNPAMGARNQVGIGLSYRPASLCSLAILNSRLGSWNRFLAPQRVFSFRLKTKLPPPPPPFKGIVACSGFLAYCWTIIYRDILSFAFLCAIFVKAYFQHCLGT
jgi:hypothetical protein